MIEVYHAATDATYEYANGQRWHVDDKGQLHILGARDDDGFGVPVASHARGEWSSVRHAEGGEGKA